MTTGGAAPVVLRAAGLLLVALAVQGAVLWWSGQSFFCTCGTVRLWSGDVLGIENSQQLFDWYTFSHVIHGLVFFFLIRLVAPRLPILWVFAVALGLEVAWEVVENSRPVIEHYRLQPLSKDYGGDSVINSLMDTVAMSAGFLFALRFGFWPSVAAALALEVAALIAVRDGLVLNVIQFIRPIPWIEDWQAGHS